MEPVLSSDSEIRHPTPAQAFELASKHAALLRALFNHPQFAYLSPPTPERYPVDLERTPSSLYFVADFVQNTYINYVLPFLPRGATRKCKAIANPWAYASADYKWELEWDAAAGALRNIQTGESDEFPRLSENSAKGKVGDLVMRGWMTRKCILENRTDIKVRLMMGGAEPFDFGDEVVRALEECYSE